MAQPHHHTQLDDYYQRLIKRDLSAEPFPLIDLPSDIIFLIGQYVDSRDGRCKTSAIHLVYSLCRKLRAYVRTYALWWAQFVEDEHRKIVQEFEERRYVRRCLSGRRSCRINLRMSNYCLMAESVARSLRILAREGNMKSFFREIEDRRAKRKHSEIDEDSWLSKEYTTSDNSSDDDDGDDDDEEAPDEEDEEDEDQEESSCSTYLSRDDGYL
jgi:hypothetical protein